MALDYIHTGLMVSDSVGPSNPQLAAALAAAAAGLADQSREHFDTALRQARDVPIRILQPTVLYWSARSLSTAADTADRSRDRASRGRAHRLPRARDGAAREPRGAVPQRGPVGWPGCCRRVRSLGTTLVRPSTRQAGRVPSEYGPAVPKPDHNQLGVLL